MGQQGAEARQTAASLVYNFNFNFNFNFNYENYGNATFWGCVHKDRLRKIETRSRGNVKSTACG